MGLFDKKNCSICEAKTNMLTNRKLADGNLCVNCAKQLSPFTEGRKNQTVADIQDHLAYREANKAEVASFNPTREFGVDMSLFGFGDAARVFFDDNKGAFILTRSAKKWREQNPDVIKFSQVKGCSYGMDQRSVVTQGASNSISEREYDTILNVKVDSPYFESAKLQLNNQPTSSAIDKDQVEYTRLAQDIKDALLAEAKLDA